MVILICWYLSHESEHLKLFQSGGCDGSAWFSICGREKPQALKLHGKWTFPHAATEVKGNIVDPIGVNDGKMVTKHQSWMWAYFSSQVPHLISHLKVMEENFVKVITIPMLQKGLETKVYPVKMACKPEWHVSDIPHVMKWHRPHKTVSCLCMWCSRSEYLYPHSPPFSDLLLHIYLHVNWTLEEGCTRKQIRYCNLTVHNLVEILTM